ncbi:hypothetical protein U9M48_034963, partial [Paspalum notatum var. saurae]
PSASACRRLTRTRTGAGDDTRMAAAAVVVCRPPPPSLPPTRAGFRFSSSPSTSWLAPTRWHPPRSVHRPLPCASLPTSPPSSVFAPEPGLEPEPPHDEAQDESRPRRIALFVEPSPFAYVSGYKNRFQNFIKYLREMGDEVIVVTTHEGVPQEFHGAKLIGSWRSPLLLSLRPQSLLFPCPWYQKVPLSLALSPRIIGEVARFKPDIIHASSPGIMEQTSNGNIAEPGSQIELDFKYPCSTRIPVFGALIIAKLLCVPLVMSYHTHVPIYIPRYTFSWLVKPMWLIIKFLHRAADLTLVPSVAIGRDLQAARVTAANKIRLWNKGVDSESFHPRFRNKEMRSRLTSNGEPEKPLILYVGRLGVEKSLDFLKRVMDQLPGSRIAFVGDGPFRAELEQMFSGMPAVFTGTLQGEELSQAYASGDVFVMPSESETLGFVVLEAMSSGVPVVGARAGGIPDIIPEDQEGKTSFLYTPGDVDDCVGKIERLLSCEVLRETMGRAARKEMEKFDWRAATRKIRNEQYSAAIWFWRKKRAQLLRPFHWVVRRLGLATAVVKQS